MRPRPGRPAEGTGGGGCGAGPGGAAGPPPRAVSVATLREVCEESCGARGRGHTQRGSPQGRLTRRTGRRPRGPRLRHVLLPGFPACLGPRRGGSAISERTFLPQPGPTTAPTGEARCRSRPRSGPRCLRAGQKPRGRGAGLRNGASLSARLSRDLRDSRCPARPGRGAPSFPRGGTTR